MSAGVMQPVDYLNTHPVGEFVGRCLARHRDGPQADKQGDDIIQLHGVVSTGGFLWLSEVSHHVEGIGHQRQGMDGEANAQLEQEEDGVEGQHHLDARRLGPRHPGRARQRLLLAVPVPETEVAKKKRKRDSRRDTLSLRQESVLNGT